MTDDNDGDGWVHFKLNGYLVGIMNGDGKNWEEIVGFMRLLASRRGVSWRDIDFYEGPGTLPADEDEPVQHTTRWKEFNRDGSKRKGA